MKEHREQLYKQLREEERADLIEAIKKYGKQLDNENGWKFDWSWDDDDDNYPCVSANNEFYPHFLVVVAIKYYIDDEEIVLDVYDYDIFDCIDLSNFDDGCSDCERDNISFRDLSLGQVDKIIKSINETLRNRDSN